jgi:hypothetical protein
MLLPFVDMRRFSAAICRDISVAFDAAARLMSWHAATAEP